jgi:hypothetical protein
MAVYRAGLMSSFYTRLVEAIADPSLRLDEGLAGWVGFVRHGHRILPKRSSDGATEVRLGHRLFRDAEAKHPIEIVGKEIRVSMPFLDPVSVEEVAKTR